MDASEMVELIETALSQNPLVAQITVDGETVRMDRRQAMQELAYWRKQVAKEAGTFTRFRGVDLGSAW